MKKQDRIKFVEELLDQAEKQLILVEIDRRVASSITIVGVRDDKVKDKIAQLGQTVSLLETKIRALMDMIDEENAK